MKKIISVFLSLFIMASSLTFTNVFAYDLDDEYNKNITYKYDRQNNVLTFEGKGKLIASGDLHEGGCKFLSNSDWDKFSTTTKKIVIGEGITEIDVGSFWRFEKLQTVVLPNTLTDIDDFAFYECYNLENINLTDSITVIGKEAFRSCRKLSKIYLGESLNELGKNNFLDCTNLTDIELNQNNKKFVYKDNGLYTANMRKLIYVNKNTKAFNIDEKCTTIKSFAFNQSSITNLFIPSTVKKVEGGAFYNSRIQKIAFSKKSRVKRLTDSVACYGDETGERYGIFDNCVELKTLILPKLLKNTDYCMLLNCKKLTKIKFGENVKSISGTNFIGCESLKKITVSKKNKYYRSYKNVLYTKNFKDLIAVPASLTKININSKTTCIENHAFSSSKIKNITIPKKVEAIDYGAFFNCRNLKNINFEKGSKLKTLGEPTEYSTSIDTGYEDYKKNNFYDYDTFENCNKLKKVILPDSVVYMTLAFSNCKRLKHIHLGKNFKSTNPWDDTTIFESFGIKSLKKITVSKANKYYYNKNGKLYYKDTKTVAWKPKKK